MPYGDNQFIFFLFYLMLLRYHYDFQLVGFSYPLQLIDRMAQNRP